MKNINSRILSGIFLGAILGILLPVQLNSDFDSLPGFRLLDAISMLAWIFTFSYAISGQKFIIGASKFALIPIMVLFPIVFRSFSEVFLYQRTSLLSIGIYLKQIGFYSILPLMSCIQFNRGVVKRVENAFIWLPTVFLALSILEKYFPTSIFEEYFGPENRLAGIFGNPIVTGNFFLVLCNLYFAFIVENNKRSKSKTLNFAMSLIFVIASGSRESIIGILISVVLWTYYFRKIIIAKVFSLSLTLIPIGIFSYLYLQFSSSIARFTNISTDYNFISRLIAIQVGIKAILDQPIAGFGIGNILPSIEKYYNNSREISGVINFQPIGTTDSLIIDIAVQTGILGAVSIIIFQIWMLVTFSQLKSKLPSQNTLNFSVIVNSFCLSVIGFASSTLLLPKISAIYFLIIGFVILKYNANAKTSKINNPGDL